MTENGSNPQIFDVVISGGGLSGLLTAIGLRQESPELNIAIVDPNATTKPQFGLEAQQTEPQLNFTNNFDGRCIALSYGSLKLLQHWHVWPRLKPHAWPIKTIVTSDKGHIGKTILKASDFQLSAMGYVAEMRNIGQIFQQTLAQMAEQKMSWFVQTEISAICHQGDYTKLTLTDGNELHTKLLVVAEGGMSSTKSLLGIENDTADYSQTAVVANIKTQGADGKDGKFAKLLRHPNLVSKDFVDAVAFERFTTHGPIALLPIGPQQYSVVWTESHDKADDISKLTDTEFCKALQAEFGFAAGEIIEAGERASFPLYCSKAQNLTHNRVVLLGNAAHTVHPIAGQGFNLGLRDIAVLVNEIKVALDNKQDIGSFRLLNQYQNNRVDDINRITTFTDSLVRIFGLEGRLPAFVRTIGLMSLQKFDPLQQWLALHFMGSQSAKNIPQLTQLPQLAQLKPLVQEQQTHDQN
ncbi:FAD-dependent monooxygenase [Psychrosphaera sp. 1_MG-2023]|uniref:FAD-dependent monooxygenase n=1 Tax=Psychrosphaera sp. 1_MG-2023 TaxID=3062643 RepID=UPI0026E335BA|nr:FAD-dependent monooxygenase [Psychrosphaera sp. 1_MG-2023]MDO6720779.1 FAD-dependent monooxygenase [Psychrosphaera sp. 1_MG-2023]